MYLNYSVSHLLNLFFRNISKYTIYPFIIISSIILLFILLKNKDSYSKYIIIGIDIILSFIIVVNYILSKIWIFRSKENSTQNN